MIPTKMQMKELNKVFSRFNGYEYKQDETKVFDTIEQVLKHFRVDNKFKAIEDIENYIDLNFGDYVFYNCNNSLYYVLEV